MATTPSYQLLGENNSELKEISTDKDEECEHRKEDCEHSLPGQVLPCANSCCVYPIYVVGDMLARINSGQMLGRFKHHMRCLRRVHLQSDWIEYAITCLHVQYQHFRGKSRQALVKANELEQRLSASCIPSRHHLLQFLQPLQTNMLRAIGEPEEAEAVLLGVVQTAQLVQCGPVTHSMFRELCNLRLHQQLIQGRPLTNIMLHNSENLYIKFVAMASQLSRGLLRVDQLAKYQMEYGFLLLRCCPSGRHLMLDGQQTLFDSISQWQDVRKILQVVKTQIDSAEIDVNDAVFYYYLLNCDLSIREAQIQTKRSLWKNYIKKAMNYAQQAKDVGTSQLKNWRSFMKYIERRDVFLTNVFFTDELYDTSGTVCEGDSGSDTSPVSFPKDAEQDELTIPKYPDIVHCSSHIGDLPGTHTALTNNGCKQATFNSDVTHPKHRETCGENQHISSFSNHEEYILNRDMTFPKEGITFSNKDCHLTCISPAAVDPQVTSTIDITTETDTQNPHVTVQNKTCCNVTNITLEKKWVGAETNVKYIAHETESGGNSTEIIRLNIPVHTDSINTSSNMTESRYQAAWPSCGDVTEETEIGYPHWKFLEEPEEQISNTIQKMH